MGTTDRWMDGTNEFGRENSGNRNQPLQTNAFGGNENSSGTRFNSKIPMQFQQSGRFL